MKKRLNTEYPTDLKPLLTLGRIGAAIAAICYPLVERTPKSAVNVELHVTALAPTSYRISAVYLWNRRTNSSQTFEISKVVKVPVKRSVRSQRIEQVSIKAIMNWSNKNHRLGWEWAWVQVASWSRLVILVLVLTLVLPRRLVNSKHLSLCMDPTQDINSRRHYLHLSLRCPTLLEARLHDLSQACRPRSITTNRTLLVFLNDRDHLPGLMSSSRHHHIL